MSGKSFKFLSLLLSVDGNSRLTKRSGDGVSDRSSQFQKLFGLNKGSRMEIENYARQNAINILRQTPDKASPASNEDDSIPLHIRALCWRPKKHNPKVAGEGDAKITYNVPSEEDYKNKKNYLPWCIDWLGCIEQNAGCSAQTNFTAGDACSAAVRSAWSPPNCGKVCNFHDPALEAKGHLNVNGTRTSLLAQKHRAQAPLVNGTNSESNASKGTKADCMATCQSWQETVSDCVAETMFYAPNLRKEKKDKPFSFGVKTGTCYMSVQGTYAAMAPGKITSQWMGGGKCGMHAL